MMGILRVLAFWLVISPSVLAQADPFGNEFVVTAVPGAIEIRVNASSSFPNPWHNWMEIGVYRNDTDDFSTAKRIHIVESYRGLITHDLEARVNETYFYWLVNENAATPATPLFPAKSATWTASTTSSHSVRATKGIYEDFVRLTWHQDSEAASYRLTCGETFDSREEIAIVPAGAEAYDHHDGSVVRPPFYNPKNPVPYGQLYWIETIYEDGSTSAPSHPDNGYRAWHLVKDVNLARDWETGEVHLTWDPSGDEDFVDELNENLSIEFRYSLEGYTIFRKPTYGPSPHPLTDLGTVPVGVSSFSEEIPDPDESYTYYVRAKIARIAHGSFIDYLYSNEGAPHDSDISQTGVLRVTGETSRYIEIAWTPTANAYRYYIARQVNGGPALEFDLFTVDAPTTVFRDESVIHGIPMDYWVFAETQEGAIGPPSQIVTATRLPVPQPTNVDASDGLYSEHVKITWDRVDDVDGYLVRSPGLGQVFIPQSDEPTLTFLDTTADPGFVTSYLVTAFHLVNDNRIQSPYTSEDWTTGYRLELPPLPAPVNFSAAQPPVTDKIGLSWDAVDGAQRYDIYASIQSANDPDSFSLFEKVGETDESTFDFRNSLPGRLYRLRVHAWRENGGLSEASTVIESYRIPSPVSNFTATEGTKTNGITLRWKATESAPVRYHVLRSVTNDLSTAVEIAQTEASEYSDTTVRPNIDHYYWVIAQIYEITSPPGTSVVGRRAIAPPSSPSASNRNSPDHVLLTWNMSTVAYSYNIYRSTTNHFSAATRIANTTGKTYLDTSAIAGTTYRYWITSVIPPSGESVPTPSVTGIRLEEIPLSPQAVTASDGTYSSYVQITWALSPGALKYRVYRGSSASSTGATPIAVLSDANATSYEDTTATPEDHYFYFVRADSLGGTSELSAGDEGWAAPLSAPTAPTGAVTLPADPAEEVSTSDIDAGTETTGRFTGLLYSATGEVTGAIPKLDIRFRKEVALFSGSIIRENRSIRVKGQFNAEGYFSGTVSFDRELTRVAIRLQLAESDRGGLKIIGTVGDDEVDLYRLVWHAKANPFGDHGAYTFLVPENHDASTAMGIATARIDQGGNVRCVGITPDGARFAARSWPSQDSEMVLFAKQRRASGKPGYLGANLRFRNLPEVSDIDGEVTLATRGEPSKTAIMMGSRYEGETYHRAAQVSLLDLPDLENLDVLWSEKNVIALPDDTRLKLKANAKTGAIRGQWRDRETGQKLKIEAVIFPKQNVAGGLHVEKSGVTGGVILEPKP